MKIDEKSSPRGPGALPVPWCRQRQGRAQIQLSLLAYPHLPMSITSPQDTANENHRKITSVAVNNEAEASEAEASAMASMRAG
jgi:hypothetical protein